MSASSVLASFRPSTYPEGTRLSPSLAAALLNGHFEHPADYSTLLPYVLDNVESCKNRVIQQTLDRFIIWT